MKELTIAEIKKISKLLPTFIMMCENDLGEEEHTIKKPLTAGEFEQIERLLSKANTCIQFVNTSIFELY